MDRVKLREAVAKGDAELLMAVSQEELDALTQAILDANRIFVAALAVQATTSRSFP